MGQHYILTRGDCQLLSDKDIENLEWALKFLKDYERKKGK